MVRFGVLAGGALEAGQVGGYCQPQLISERPGMTGEDGGQLSIVHHDLTLRPLLTAVKSGNSHHMRLP